MNRPSEMRFALIKYAMQSLREFNLVTADAHVEQTFFKGVGQSGFSAAGKAGKPDQTLTGGGYD